MKKNVAILGMICICLIFAVSQVQAQQASSAATQGQGQSSTNTIVGGTQSITGGEAAEIPRSWMIPMTPPAAPNFPYYGGPYRWGREYVPDAITTKFKKRYDIGELRNLAARPGGLIPTVTVYQRNGFSPFVEFTTQIPPNPESERRFEQAYELVAEASVEGSPEKTESKSSKNVKNQIGDTAKIRGYVGVLACEIGANLVVCVQQDGNFEQYGDSSYKSLGISMGSQSGGAGAGMGGVIGFSTTWGHARMGHQTRPYTVYYVFKSTGRQYVPYFPPPQPQVQVVPAPQPSGPTAAAPNNNRGGKGIQDIKQQNQLQYERPTPSVLQQERR